MTPLQLSMLLHYHWNTRPYGEAEPEHASSPAVFEQRRSLVRQGLLEVVCDSETGWQVTDRGRVHIEALCALPLPICKWVTPNAKS